MAGADPGAVSTLSEYEQQRQRQADERRRAEPLRGLHGRAQDARIRAVRPRMCLPGMWRPAACHSASSVPYVPRERYHGDEALRLNRERPNQQMLFETIGRKPSAQAAHSRNEG